MSAAMTPVNHHPKHPTMTTKKPKHRQPPVIIHPVRTIKRAVRGRPIPVLNALSSLRLDTRWPRHASLDRMLGSLARPDLERVLRKVTSA